MLLQRDDPIPRDDRALIAWQRVILALLLLAVLGLGVAGLLLGALPTEELAPPFYVTMMGDRAG